MKCQECKADKPEHEFYDKNGNPASAKLILTNSCGTWQKSVCYDCWTEFQSRAFVTIERHNNTFTATCAF
jgi:hypothetical protein